MGCGRLLCARCRLLDVASLTAVCSTCEAASQGAGAPAGSAAKPVAASSLNPASAQRRSPSPALAAAPTDDSGIREPIPLTLWPKAMLRLLTAPSQFFANLQPTQGVARALGFGLLWSCLATLTGVALYPLLYGEAHPLLANPQMQAAIANSAYASEIGPITLFFSLGLALLAIGTLSVFFLGAIYHGALYALGIRPGTMRPTLKIAAYALSGQAFLALPGDDLPALLARVFTTALLVIGLRQTYQVTFLRAALVVALPMLLNLHIGFDSLVLLRAQE
jgi:hypothetical protein